MLQGREKVVPKLILFIKHAFFSLAIFKNWIEVSATISLIFSFSTW